MLDQSSLALRSMLRYQSWLILVLRRRPDISATRRLNPRHRDILTRDLRTRDRDVRDFIRDETSVRLETETSRPKPQAWTPALTRHSIFLRSQHTTRLFNAIFAGRFFIHAILKVNCFEMSGTLVAFAKRLGVILFACSMV